jgi:hypothetical protein
VVGATVLGEKMAQCRALGGGLILAGILLHSWVRKTSRDRIAETPNVAARRPATGCHREVANGRVASILIPNSQ